MTRKPGLVLTLVIATLGLAMTACSENPVGRKCDLGIMPDVSQSIVASPSLDCVSRTCLRVPNRNLGSLPEGNDLDPNRTTNIGLCTAECESEDDCDRVPESPCQLGFSCGIPVVVGPFCCRKFCICKDYLVTPDEDVATKPQCDPSVAENTCCNLEGRSGNPAYPNCP